MTVLKFLTEIGPDLRRFAGVRSALNAEWVGDGMAKQLLSTSTPGNTEA